MLTISISTASKECSLFFSGAYGEDYFAQTSVDMVSYIPEVMERVRRKYSNEKISKILISSGPGYYTGLRIGEAFAKGMLASDKLCRLIQVGSLDTMAFKLKEEKKLITLLKARKGICHAALFENGKRLSENFLIEERMIGFINGYSVTGEGAIGIVDDGAILKDGIYPDAKSMFNYYKESLNERGCSCNSCI